MIDIVKLLGPGRVARWAGCSGVAAGEWRGKPVPMNRCPAIERGSRGLFKVEQLNPSAPWVRIPDPDWPWHPDGRPVLDVIRLFPGQPLSAEEPERAAA